MSEARNIAEERFARGEISKEEFEEILSSLSEPEVEYTDADELTVSDHGSSGGFSVLHILLYWVVGATLLQFFFVKSLYCIFVVEGSLVGTKFGHAYNLLVSLPGILGTILNGAVFGSYGSCG